MNLFPKKSGLKFFSKTAMSFHVLGTTYCFCKIRCVFLIRVFVFGEGRNLCDISTQTESHPNNILTATLGRRKQLSRVAKTCQPCQPAGANFSRPVLIFGQSTRKTMPLCPMLISLIHLYTYSTLYH